MPRDKRSRVAIALTVRIVRDFDRLQSSLVRTNTIQIQAQIAFCAINSIKIELFVTNLYLKLRID